MMYSFTDKEMARLREAMDRAPSILRQRPWDLRRVADDRVEVRSVPDQDLGKLLPREVVISCGAALYNLRLAIRVAGRHPSVWLLPGLNLRSGLLTTVASAETLLASVEITQDRPYPPNDAEQELYEALWLGRTDRRLHQYVPVPPAILVEMENAATHEHYWLRTLPGRQRRQALRAVASANKKIREENKLTERLAELNMPRAGFGPTPPAARRRTQLMALSTDGDHPLDWLRAGEALQHALLNGTRLSMSALGGRSTPYRQQFCYAPLGRHRLWRRRPAPNGYAVEASFLTQSLELADLRDLGPEGLAALELADLTGSQPGRGRWRWPWRWYFTEIPQVLMRVGYVEVNRVTAPGGGRYTEPIPRPAHDSLYIVPSPRPASGASPADPVPRQPDDDSYTGPARRSAEGD